MKKRALLLIVLCTAGTSRATIIFVTLTRNAIYIGADGRATNMDAAGNEIGPSDACKIRNFGNYTVVDSGIASYPWTGFNVWEYFASIKATSVADFSNQLKEQLPPKFQTAYTDLKKRTGKVIAVPGDIGVMAFEGGKPVFIWIFFFVQDETVKAAVHNDGRELDLNSGKAFYHSNR
jgi:hypothetical protein